MNATKHHLFIEYYDAYCFVDLAASAHGVPCGPGSSGSLKDMADDCVTGLFQNEHVAIE